jgi:HAMP domain-containing protein
LAFIVGLGTAQTFPAGFVAISLVAAAVAGLFSYVWLEAPLSRALRRAGTHIAHPARIKVGKLIPEQS